MAAEEQAASKGLGFLTQKLGPLPVVAWGGIGLVIFLLVQRQQKKTTTAGAAGSGTDAAGNQGTLDPATGFVYGSPEDLASLHGVLGGGASDNSGGGSGGGGGRRKPDGPEHRQQEDHRDRGHRTRLDRRRPAGDAPEGQP